MRPARDQIDLWPSLGLEIDWDILFNNSRKGENFQIPSQRLIDLGAGYESSAHGFDGPLLTCISPNIATSDTNDIFTQSMEAVGIPHRIEFNGGDLRGAGIQQATQNSTAKIREDAARAYYYPIADERPNLSVMVNTTGLRIIWKENNLDGKSVAAGVEIRNQDGTVSTVSAKREVILSAGAIRSPVILERSGVGNPSILSQHSIDVKVELPAVGENFQDQPTLSIIGPSFRNETGFPAYVTHVSLHDLFGNETDAVYTATLAKLPEYSRRIAEYNSGASDASAQERLLRSQLDLLFASNTPAVEIVPAAIGTIAGAIFWVQQPFSRGSVHIGSVDSDNPRIDTKLFDLDFDGILSIAAAKWILKFLDTPPVSGILNGSAIVPAFGLQGSDEEWLDYFRNVTEPNYHHLGTCAMLPRELGGVVDNDFRVYGTENVRVVDLGIIPVQIAGHSMAPLYGIAEWAVQKILSSAC